MLILIAVFVSLGQYTTAAQPFTLPLHRSSDDELIVYGDGETQSYADVYYLVKNVKLGNPPQTFNLTLRTDSYWTYVFNKGLIQETCATNPGHRTYFDMARSTTLRVGKPEQNVFIAAGLNLNASCQSADYEPYGTAVHVTDDFRFGSAFVYKSAPFVVVTNISATLDSNWPSDGVLGLMRNDGVETNGSSTIHRLASAAGSPEVTMFFKRSPNSADDAGLLTIGGTNTRNCDSQWFFFKPLHGLVNWNVPATSSRIGGVSFTVTLVEFSASGSTIWLTPKPFAELARATSAKGVGSGRYTVDCAKIQQFPVIAFSMAHTTGNFEFVVPPSDYVKRLNNGKCVLDVQSDETFTFWIVGTAAKGYCWAMNFDNETFGIARAL